MDKERMAQQIIRGCSGKRCCQIQNKIQKMRHGSPRWAEHLLGTIMSC